MPYLGNTGTALYPSQLQTSSLTTDTGDGLISISDIVNGTSSTDSGIRLSSGGVESALFTEEDGTILSYGINISQIGSTAGTPAYDTTRSGGIFRLNTRTAVESGSLSYDKHCFVFIGRGEGETTEYTALGIDLNTGNTSLAPVNGGVGIGFDTAPETLLDIRGEGQDTAQVSVRQWNDGSGTNPNDGPDIRFHTSRGTVASPLGVQSGDHIGRFNSFIYNGTDEIHSGSFGWSSIGTAGEAKFTISTRIAVTGGTSLADRLTIDSDGNISFIDDQKILIGTDGDLELYHDSQYGGSYINKTSSGTFYIRGVSGNHIKIQALPGEDSIVAAANGKVELFYNNNSVLETSNSGVTISDVTVTGTAKLVRQNIGGTDNTGNTPNTYWKVGTWYGLDQSSRAKIVINGAEEYGNNTNAFGETVINLVLENSNNIEGTFYTIGGNEGPVDVAVKVNLTPDPDICEIWVKYEGNYASNAITVDVTDGYFVGESTNTSSGTLPSGATSLQSFFALRTVGSTNDEQIRVDQNGLTVQKHIRTNLDYPTIRPALKFIFNTSTNLDSRITFSRASSGTYIGSDGLVKTASYDEPRFDHDPITRQNLGLLIEETRTNLVTDADGGNYGYGLSGAPASEPSLYDTAPDGSYVQCKYDASSLTGSIFVNCDINTPLTAGTTYTLSAWLRSDTITGTVSFAFVGETNYEIHSHALNSSHAQGAITSKWKRFELTFTLTGAQSNSRFQVFFGTQASGEIISVWGAQLEQGPFKTSYIPREAGAQSTRTEDDVFLLGDNFTSWFNPDEGTMIASYDKYYDEFISTPNNFYPTVFALGSWPYRINIGAFGGTSTQQATVAVNGTFTFHSVTGSGPLPINTELKAGITYKENDFSSIGYDRNLLLDTSGALPDLLSEKPWATIGGEYSSSNAQLNGHVKTIVYYNQKLTDSQLINVTL